ncbi:MAG: hypothetical protein DI533_03240 [Cereibacter sphaeroides]|uniref:Uncharacterized protein n=1 Tax=Cereibacter sphaeroides TaxID=1063 RepID=A0A2W5SCR8_CERSP|nr:MAG: hypothetical protein DI533_03240 [Cereibacter sphaeroides]
MTLSTPLDAAFTAMSADPEADQLRLRFYQRVADSELFLLLEGEPDGDAVTPQIFDIKEGPVVLAFDREERLAAFVGAPAAYASLPGRTVAEQLAGKGIGIGLNLGVAPSSYLIPADAVDWLADMLAQGPAQVEATPIVFQPPGDLPQALIEGLDAKLARAGGLAVAAFLAGVTYEGGRRGHVLAFIGAVPGAEAALAREVSEALTFSGLDAGELDVVFLSGEDALAESMARVALRFDLPAVVLPKPPPAPGLDPAKPPRFK